MIATDRLGNNTLCGFLITASYELSLHAMRVGAVVRGSACGLHMSTAAFHGHLWEACHNNLLGFILTECVCVCVCVCVILLSPLYAGPWKRACVFPNRQLLTSKL
ncbi:unnamed protein product [Gadus morhua 'NCC']